MMRLFASRTSPYARKVLVVANEKCLRHQLDVQYTDPLENPDALQQSNPLGKVPVLITDSGTALFDSRVICEFLDDFGAQPELIPRQGSARWQTLRVSALADGVLDAAVALVMEGRRPQAEQSAWWVERWRAGIDRSISVLAAELGSFSAVFTVAAAGVAVTLSYLDFRHPDMDWRSSRPEMAAWLEEVSRRASMRATLPPEDAAGVSGGNQNG